MGLPATANPTSASTRRPSVVVITLDNVDFLLDLYGEFMDMLKTKADVEHITTPREASAAFRRTPRPMAILSADESLTVSTRITLVHEAGEYARAGGTLVFMGLFSSCVGRKEIDGLFSRLDLPWVFGSYGRRDFKLNRAATHLDVSGLLPQYSQKAIHLENVAPEDALYVNVYEDDRPDGPVALAKVGRGFVGYVGDVNNEEGSQAVVLKMCGL